MLADYMTILGYTLEEKGEGFHTACPFHSPDDNPSFSIYGENSEKFHCFPCVIGGDVFDLSQRLGRSTDFRSALADVRKVVSVRGDIEAKRPAIHSGGGDQGGHSGKKPKFELPDGDFKRIWDTKMEFANALFKNSEVIRKASSELGFDVRLMQGFSPGLIDGLGVYEDHLAYVYQSGLKVRRFKNEGSPRFFWAIGKATLPWRASKIKAGIEQVILCESETDAMACLISGLEDDGRTAVVASPGVGFKKEWAPIFKGKAVIIGFDFDEPGQQAAENVAKMLTGVASNVAIVRNPVAGKEGI